MEKIPAVFATIAKCHTPLLAHSRILLRNCHSCNNCGSAKLPHRRNAQFVIPSDEPSGSIRLGEERQSVITSNQREVEEPEALGGRIQGSLRFRSVAKPTSYIGEATTVPGIVHSTPSTRAYLLLPSNYCMFGTQKSDCLLRQIRPSGVGSGDRQKDLSGFRNKNIHAALTF